MSPEIAVARWLDRFIVDGTKRSLAVIARRMLRQYGSLLAVYKAELHRTEIRIWHLEHPQISRPRLDCEVDELAAHRRNRRYLRAAIRRVKAGYRRTRIRREPGQPVSGERADTKPATPDSGDAT